MRRGQSKIAMAASRFPLIGQIKENEVALHSFVYSVLCSKRRKIIFTYVKVSEFDLWLPNWSIFSDWNSNFRFSQTAVTFVGNLNIEGKFFVPNNTIIFHVFFFRFRFEFPIWYLTNFAVEQPVSYQRFKLFTQIETYNKNVKILK